MKKRKAVKNKPLYFLDVETTGLNPKMDRIIEFCIIKKTRFETTSIHKRVSPEGMRIEPKAKEINGYSAQKWKDAISQKEASRLISGFMFESGIIIAHNSSFDAQFINSLLQKHGYKAVARRRVDTYTLAYEHLVPLGLKSLGFDEIRRFMGWKVHDHHDAKTDAFDVYRFHQFVNRLGHAKRLHLILKSIRYRMRKQ